MRLLTRLVRASVRTLFPRITHQNQKTDERTMTVDGLVWTRQRGKWIATETEHDSSGRVIAITLRTRTADHPSMVAP